jgi:mono/diheme cytochrome c family protein
MRVAKSAEYWKVIRDIYFNRERAMVKGIRIVGGILGTALLVAVWQGPSTAGGQDQDLAPPSEDAPTSIWMEKKLAFSQRLLRDLAVGDFDDLVATGQKMRLVGKVEGFVRSPDPVYRDHLKSFALANDHLIRQAAAKNLEGATLAFQQMTGSCVACHQALRLKESGGATGAGGNSH